MKKFIFLAIGIIILAIVAFFFIRSKEPSGHVCKQEYALCTSAPCIPDPRDPSKAICNCDVLHGDSYGMLPCNKRAPQQKDGVTTLRSTYSFAQYATHRTMKCPSGNPWTYCLDSVCTKDPTDPQKAICVCKVFREGAFYTLGGNCNTGTCKDAYWSGALEEDVEEAMNVMVKALKLKSAPKNPCKP